MTTGDGLSGLAHSESLDEVVARYDGWVSDYDRDLASWNYQVPKYLAAQARACLGPDPLDVPILDAGCGTGLIGRELRALGLGPVFGLDASQSSVARAAETGAYASVEVADLTCALRFSDDSFAAAVCGGVLTYLKDTGFVLSELARVVRPGGVVLASQRTDLWIERDCDAVIASLMTKRKMSVTVSDPQPYLPGHPEYADQIKVIYLRIDVVA